MGYTTTFTGKFSLNKQLSLSDKIFLDKLANTRRMARNIEPIYGVEGELFVDGGGVMGQDRDDTIIDYNRPPSTQPGLWLQWVPTKDGLGIEWDGNEKFYNYVQWLQYLILKVLSPKGYILNGDVKYYGEDREDFGTISVKNNIIQVFERKI